MANVATINNSLGVKLGIPSDLLELIHKTVAQDTNAIEFELFVRRCQTLGFDPLGKMLYPIVRSKDDPSKRAMTLQTGIDGFRSIAGDTGELDGIDEATYKYDGNGKLFSASIAVYRKGATHPFVGTAIFDEYAVKDFKGNLTSFWSKMAHSQLEKCAEAKALRRAFPRKLSGLYTDDEMQQADRVDRSDRNVTPSRATVTNTAPARAALPATAQAPGKGSESSQDALGTPPPSPSKGDGSQTPPRAANGAQEGDDPDINPRTGEPVPISTAQMRRIRMLMGDDEEAIAQKFASIGGIINLSKSIAAQVIAELADDAEAK